MAASKGRAIDGCRRAAMQDRKQAEIAREMDEAHAMSIESVEAGLDDDLGDELLGLIFAACHPAISPEARAALTLRLVGGLTAREIARAFPSNEAAIAARITRAQQAIAKARSEEHTSELQSLMRLSYAVFFLTKKKTR